MEVSSLTTSEIVYCHRIFNPINPVFPADYPQNVVDVIRNLVTATSVVGVSNVNLADEVSYSRQGDLIMLLQRLKHHFEPLIEVNEVIESVLVYSLNVSEQLNCKDGQSVLLLHRLQNGQV